MNATTQIFLGTTLAGAPLSILSSMANRHGLIAGATGTGKTATLRTLAESFSRAGVPVFTADVKGDVAGMAFPGTSSAMLEDRKSKLSLSSHTLRGYPVLFWDILGVKGHPIRTTVSEFGPLLFARLLDLNDTQEGVLNAIFKLADDRGMLLLDLKDLRAILGWALDNASALQAEYGNIAKASVGAIQRNLLVLEQAGGDEFFGEPALKFEHLLQRDFSGNGVISVLDATSIIQNPRIYSTFLLWLLSELFEQLPEVGDLEKPKLVFFFDEAHLLFNNAPRALMEKVEQVVRLVRSKGVGIYFVTQNPIDIPDDVAGQLGNRVQHALRAFTAKDQRAVEAAAETFRQNPALKTEKVITELGVGEALVSVLDAAGTPTPVERVLIAPPESRMAAISDAERAEVLDRSPLKGVYEQAVDRESAYEILQRRMTDETAAASTTSRQRKPASTGRTRQGPLEAMITSASRSIGSQLGREIMRGILGSILGKR